MITIKINNIYLYFYFKRYLRDFRNRKAQSKSYIKRSMGGRKGKLDTLEFRNP